MTAAGARRSDTGHWSTVDAELEPEEVRAAVRLVRGAVLEVVGKVLVGDASGAEPSPIRISCKVSIQTKRFKRPWGQSTEDVPRSESVVVKDDNVRGGRVWPFGGIEDAVKYQDFSETRQIMRYSGEATDP